MSTDIILVIVVVTALAFDFTNGFHDTANAIATSVSTRAMAPKVAVLMRAVLNFVGAFISLKVAATVAQGIVDSDADHPAVVFAGPDRRDRLEPGDVVLRPALVLVARAHRRRGRRRLRGRRRVGDQRRRHRREGPRPGVVAPILAFVVGRHLDPDRLPDRRAPAPGCRSTAATGSGSC